MNSARQASTKDDILHYLLKQGEATAQEVAAHLNVSAQATRRHLKDLEDDALIEHRQVQVGMGRPNHLYGLSRKGRDQFPAQYDDFALSLLDTLEETVGKDKVSTILRKQWERKGGDYRTQVGHGPLEERVERLVKIRQSEGYMAEWHRVDGNAAQFVITEYNCAISHIVESFPTVCGHELEMFQLALPDCLVTRTHWQANGEHRCGYLVQAPA